MCGITGWIDWERDLTGERTVLEAMTGTLANRGPDAAGIWLSTHAALGHRRLVVVDPAGGAQPMTRQRGDRVCTVAYNGELYNTADLRRELEARGHTFLTRNSDTEALLAAYMEWGPACVHRLNGIFAFAVWDSAGQSLFMARDRLGVKPLFYTRKGGALIFGSEIKAILAHPDVSPEVDTQGLAEIFVMGPSRTPGLGVFRGISELRPGQCLEYDRSGLRVRRYWSFESRPHEDDLDTTAEKLRCLLRDTVERQLVADVPVCCFLSGGLDSSAITAYASAAFKRAGLGPLHTFSVDYAGNDRHFTPGVFQPDSDAPWVRRVSEHYGTVHHNIVIETGDLVEALSAAVRANDLPGMADVDSSLYLFCREIKKNATVALSGESADELFGGYPWFYSEEALSKDTFPWVRMVRQRAELINPELADQIKPEEYAGMRYREALAEVPRFDGDTPREARMREMFYLNLTRFMPTLLDRKDRMSMAAGLEVRVPYCDHRLVEYAWNIPWWMKNYGLREKGILRRALEGIIPQDVLERRKSPYPKTHNPQYLEAVRDRLLEILDDSASPLVPLVNTGKLRETALNRGAAFGPAWFSQLMGPAQLFAYLVQVDTWLREYRVSIR
ncbi:MAG: asparagine synthase (glutamine-hydrolyzing) [Peptococcaceae bacterium]|nr:asparagine synthase (glutamine-hydrolyzing) [Peptococcaceae bacterium]